MAESLWTFAEHQGGELLETSLELISEGKRLADQHQNELCVLLFGPRLESLIKRLSPYGLNRVYVADHEIFEKYQPELFTDMVVGLVKTYDPNILLFSSTTRGQDLAPRVAARLRTNLATNCDKLELSDKGVLLQTRLIYQNKVHTTLASTGVRPQMATLTPGSTKARKSDLTKELKIIAVDHRSFHNPDSQKMEITHYIKADPKTVDISDAVLVVSGGKGVGDEEGFQLILDLAQVMNASVAGSRMAVDHQWIDRSRQIGQSGKTVAPDLMISCGISGASAHIFGMRDTKTLIAINKDKAAPLMQMADLAVEGDLHEILPVLIRRLKELIRRS